LRTWKLAIEYEGTKFHGWQDQNNARTVQGELLKAARDYFGGDVEIQGAGRTDAGVHAIAQVAHLRLFKTGAKVDKLRAPELKRELNVRLPAEVVVLDVDEAPNEFHARHDAVARAYLYQISTRRTAFSKKHVWWIKERLNVKAMAAAAKLLEGRHDFTCFRAPDPSKPDASPIVVVRSAKIEAQGHLILFHIEASHFLWKMVRRIVGSLVKIGTGEMTEQQFRGLIAGKCDPKLDVASWTAPSSGLFLERITYKEGPSEDHESSNHGRSRSAARPSAADSD
jgi:tRNA pseudouridine38-40 synthase